MNSNSIRIRKGQKSPGIHNAFIPVRMSKKTKGQQLKGRIVSALFHTFGTCPHIFTLSRIFPPGLLLELRGFTTVLVQEMQRE